MRRRRWRTVLLWVGCTSCVLISMAFVLSAWLLLSIEIPGGSFAMAVGGMVMLGTDDLYNVVWHAESRRANLALWNQWRWTPYVELPLYAVLLAVLLPTLLVWRLVPKFPRGHCRRCGYNLTGLTEARCPECGAGFDERVGVCAPLRRNDDE